MFVTRVKPCSSYIIICITSHVCLFVLFLYDVSWRILPRPKFSLHRRITEASFTLASSLILRQKHPRAALSKSVKRVGSQALHTAYAQKKNRKPRSGRMFPTRMCKNVQNTCRPPAVKLSTPTSLRLESLQEPYEQRTAFASLASAKMACLQGATSLAFRPLGTLENFWRFVEATRYSWMVLGSQIVLHELVPCSNCHMLLHSTPLWHQLVGPRRSRAVARKVTEKGFLWRIS